MCFSFFDGSLQLLFVKVKNTFRFRKYKLTFVLFLVDMLPQELDFLTADEFKVISR